MCAMKITMTPYGTEHQKLCAHLSQLQPGDLQKSKDQGGHGGTMKLARAVLGNHLFLKPKSSDGTEARNYKIVKMDPKVARWMPQVYGEMQVDGRKFLVMQNIRKSKDGKDLRQLADIKLAGRMPGLYNPIASGKEMHVTRGKGKSAATKMWMKLTSALGPNFLLTDGGFRLFDYMKSRKILKEALKDTTLAHLDQLLTDLTQLRADLKDSKVAFIGASEVDPENWTG